jgi:hypothetical protein
MNTRRVIGVTVYDPYRRDRRQGASHRLFATFRVSSLPITSARGELAWAAAIVLI